MNLKVFYEDNHIIVVYKEKNILSQKDYSNDMDMLTIIKDYIKKTHDKPNNVFLGLVHRLDRNTEGIMVFAKTSKAAARLSESIKNNQFEKKYYAIVENKVIVREQVLIDYLEKNEKEKKSYISKNGKESKLKYRVLKEVKIEGEILSLLEIELFTGRFHQIRCQLSNMGNPLYNDSKYNKNTNKTDYYLCAFYLKFKHPTKNECLKFEQIPEKDFYKKF